MLGHIDKDFKDSVKTAARWSSLPDGLTVDTSPAKSDLIADSDVIANPWRDIRRRSP